MRTPSGTADKPAPASTFAIGPLALPGDADGGEDHGVPMLPIVQRMVADRIACKSANAVFGALAAAFFGQSNRPIISTSITVRTKRPQMSAPEHAAAAPAA
jgi:hypothetical protein